MKFPIIGTVSTQVLSRGDKIRMEIAKEGHKTVEYIDGETHWEYDSEKNQITIKTEPKSQSSSSSNNMDMIKGIGDGYDAKIQKETDEAWYIRCTKNRNNPDKDAPKRMDVIVAKPDCRLVSVSANASLITITMRDFFFGVPESKVTFNPDEFPGATIVDNR